MGRYFFAADRKIKKIKINTDAENLKGGFKEKIINKKEALIKISKPLYYI